MVVKIVLDLVVVFEVMELLLLDLIAGLESGRFQVILELVPVVLV